MLKKTLIIIFVVVLLVGIMVVPTSAATGVVWLDYMDYTTKVTTSGGYDICTVKFPIDFCGIKVRAIGNDTNYVAGRSTPGDTTPNVVVNVPDRTMHYSILFGLDERHKLWIENIPDGVKCTVSATVGMPQGGAHSIPYNRFVENTVMQDNSWLQDYIKTFGQQEVIGTHTVTCEFEKQPSDFGCWIGLGLAYFEAPSADIFEFTLSDFELTFTIPTTFREDWVNQERTTVMAKNNVLLLNQETMLDDMESQQEITNEKLDALPGEFGNEMEGVIDSEKQEASDAGDSAAGDLMEMIPNESQGFMDAIQSLVSSMSYSGTDAKLPVPAITIPAIPGVMDAIQLTDELSVDFGYWVQQLPGGVLKLVQILCTIALIVYCFKELYGMIAYAMTLKGGGSSE